MNVLRRTALAVTGAVGALVLMAAPVVAAPNDVDQAFLVGAHQSNLTEIASGQAAVEKATTSEVRELGQMLVTDHQALDAQVVAAAQALGVTLPAEPSTVQKAALAEVSAQTGQAFDNAWIAAQITSHRASLALGQRELANGAEPTVKALATASAPVVQHHLDAALAAAQKYGVPTSVPAGTSGEAATSSRTLGLAVAFGGLLLLAATSLLVVRRSRA
ncbi:DUF4142 domain-containing protein [Cellulomonas aerilata]|nr:DUF4142 domain-containing protein [Cellulomonas aerilata]